MANTLVAGSCRKVDRHRKPGRQSERRTRPLPLPRRRKNAGAQASSLGSAMSGDLVWNSLDRSFVGSHGGPGKGFHHFPCSFGIGDPLVVELVGARRDAAVAFAGIDHSGITAVHQLEEMV